MLTNIGFAPQRGASIDNPVLQFVDRHLRYLEPGSILSQHVHIGHSPEVNRGAIF